MHNPGRVINQHQVIMVSDLAQDHSQQVVDLEPNLGDLPVLGVLFRNKSITDQKSELLIFLTPKIITPSFGLVDS